jgi:hypothetical protein
MSSMCLCKCYRKQLEKKRWGSEEEEISGNRTRYCRPLEIEHVVDEIRERWRNLDFKFPIFNELEAIYSLAKIAELIKQALFSQATIHQRMRVFQCHQVLQSAKCWCQRCCQ